MSEKSYLRYVHERSFGVLYGGSGGIVVSEDGKRVLSPTGETVSVFELRSGARLHQFYEAGTYPEEGDGPVAPTTPPTVTALTARGGTIAAGYSDGSVRVFRPQGRGGDEDAMVCKLEGHRGAVRVVVLDAAGGLLVSGGADTTLVVWDLAAQTGLARLKGHRKPVSGAVLLPSGHVVSSSLDGLVKVWEPTGGLCVQTLVEHSGEVVGVSVDAERGYVISAGADGQLILYQCDPSRRKYLSVTQPSSSKKFQRQENSTLTPKVKVPIKVEQDSNQEKNQTSNQEKNQNQKEEEEEEEGILRTCGMVGWPSGKMIQRINDVQASATNGVVLVAVAQPPSVEMFRMRSEAEIARRQSKRGESSPGTQARDVLQWVRSERLSDKPVALSVSTTSPVLAVAQADNRLVSYRLQGEALEAAARVEQAGHRSEVRSVALSGDKQLVATGAHESIKLWRTGSGACVRTVAVEAAALTLAFVGHDQYVLAGLKSGRVLAFEVATGDVVLDETDAHSGAVWALRVLPDGLGFVTCSQDREVLFWSFQTASHQRLGAQIEERMTMVDAAQALSVGVKGGGGNTNKGRSVLWAVALADATVKVFVREEGGQARFFLSLYGHRLPVLSVDISDDGRLAVTGSADKNVKIWGLDYGDCHRSLFAHDAAVTGVRFVPDSHLFVSVGKDGLLKQWDADRFELIQTLALSASALWATALSSDAGWLASVGLDRCVRLWRLSTDPLFPDEERDLQHQAMLDRQASEPLERAEHDDGLLPPSAESLVASERLADAIERALMAETAERAHARALQTAATLHRSGESSVAPLEADPLMGGLAAGPYVLQELAGMRAAHIEDALHGLPVAQCAALLRWIAAAVQTPSPRLELWARCVSFVLRLHYGTLAAQRDQRVELRELRDRLAAALGDYREQLGANRAGLRFLRARIEDESAVPFFDDAKALREKRRSRRRAAKRSRVEPPLQEGRDSHSDDSESLAELREMGLDLSKDMDAFETASSTLPSDKNSTSSSSLSKKRRKRKTTVIL